MKTQKYIVAVPRLYREEILVEAPRGDARKAMLKALKDDGDSVGDLVLERTLDMSYVNIDEDVRAVTEHPEDVTVIYQTPLRGDHGYVAHQLPVEEITLDTRIQLWWAASDPAEREEMLDTLRSPPLNAEHPFYLRYDDEPMASVSGVVTVKGYLLYTEGDVDSLVNDYLPDGAEEHVRQLMAGDPDFSEDEDVSEGLSITNEEVLSRWYESLFTLNENLPPDTSLEEALRLVRENMNKTEEKE